VLREQHFFAPLQALRDENLLHVVDPDDQCWVRAAASRRGEFVAS
jgi:hypothetical protein